MSLDKAIELVEKEGYSCRKAAEASGVGRTRLTAAVKARSSVNQGVAATVVQGKPTGIAKALAGPRIVEGPFVEASRKQAKGPQKHLVIPDTQMKPGISTEYLRWIGEYIVAKRPDVIIHLGDHADMPSLSSYDKGKRSAEGRRVQMDIDAAKDGMVALLTPLRELQLRQRLLGEEVYRPRMVLTLGNHEERIMRHVNANPELFGFLSYDNLEYESFGWEVYDFLDPVIVDGVTYIHFMPNPMTGKPYPGLVGNTLKNVGESFTQGHKQTLEVNTRFLPFSGKQQWAIIAGACYLHDEDYKGVVGNKHWRGVILKHGVADGSYDPCFVSLKYLEQRFGK